MAQALLLSRPWAQPFLRRARCFSPARRRKRGHLPVFPRFPAQARGPPSGRAGGAVQVSSWLVSFAHSASRFCCWGDGRRVFLQTVSSPRFCTLLQAYSKKMLKCCSETIGFSEWRKPEASRGNLNEEKDKCSQGQKFATRRLAME